MNNLEIKRQFFHLFFGIVIVILLKFGIIDKWILLYLILAGIIVSILSKRMKIPIVKRQFFHLFFGIVIVILLKFGIIDKWILLYLILAGIIVSILSKRMKIPIIY